MHFTVGSSRVRLSLSRLSSTSSLPNRIDDADLERLVEPFVHSPEPGVYKIHSQSAGKDSGTWTVRKINDGEIASSSLRKALFPYFGLTASLPVVVSLWYIIAQRRVIWKHRGVQVSGDWKTFIRLILSGIDALTFGES